MGEKEKRNCRRLGRREEGEGVKERERKKEEEKEEEGTRTLLLSLSSLLHYFFDLFEMDPITEPPCNKISPIFINEPYYLNIIVLLSVKKTTDFTLSFLPAKVLAK